MHARSASAASSLSCTPQQRALHVYTRLYEVFNTCMYVCMCMCRRGRHVIGGALLSFISKL